MLCALQVFLNMLYKSGGNGAKLHQGARSDPRENHRRAPTPCDFWGGVPRRAQEIATNSSKKITGMPGKTSVEPKKTLKELRIFSMSLPCKNLGALLAILPPSNSPPGVFDIVSIPPALSDHAALRSGKESHDAEMYPGTPMPLLWLQMHCKWTVNLTRRHANISHEGGPQYIS